MAIERREDGISVTMKRDEAAALVAISETGLAVSEALRLITNTASAERALKELRGARRRGNVARAQRRPDGEALADIGETGIAVTRAVKALADLADVAAAQRALDQLRGAMR